MIVLFSAQRQISACCTALRFTVLSARKNKKCLSSLQRSYWTTTTTTNAIPPRISGGSDNNNICSKTQKKLFSRTFSSSSSSGGVIGDQIHYNKNPLVHTPAPEFCDIIKGPSLIRTSEHRPRPNLLFLPGLRSLPFWTQFDSNSQTNRVAYQDPTVSKAVELLQSHAGVIRTEYVAVSSSLKSDYETDTEHFKLHEGTWDWHSYMLKGKVQGHFCEHFPETTKILQTLRDQELLFEGTPFGYAFFSTLHAQSRIQAHTAPMNFRLRIHLPLTVPSSTTTSQQQQSSPSSDEKQARSSSVCGIRVANLQREWIPGQALVLDDAFEHEVWNDHPDETRVLLLVDIWHPDVTPSEKRDIVQLFEHARDQGWWGKS